MHPTGIPPLDKSYIGDVVFGASDGLITTFAVVAGVAGAGLAPSIVVILGIANLLADGVSMAAGGYLGHESEDEVMGKRRFHTPSASAVVIFVAFVLAGFIPLIPYILGVSGSGAFYLSVALTLVTIFTVGALRTVVTKRPWLKSGLEMLAIGSIAAFVAYIVGYFLRNIGS